MRRAAGHIGFGIIRFLISRYPPEFRELHEAEILDCVKRDHAHAARRGLVSRLTFWPRMIVDTLRILWRLHRTVSVSRRRRMAGHGRPNLAAALAVDLRHAIKALRATPVVTAVVIATLGLGIGLNTAIFSAVNAILLQPLPYEDPAALVSISARYPADGVERAHFAGRDLTEIQHLTEVFEAVAGIAPIRQNLTGTGSPEQVQVGWVTRNTFQVLGVDAAVGRGFLRDDPSGTAILSHELWVRSFGSREVLGESVQLDGYPYTIVGVMPRGFHVHHKFLPSSIDIWKVPDTWWQNGDVWGSQGVDFGILRGVARLSPDGNLTAARSAMAQLAARLRQEVPSYADAKLEFVVEPLHDNVVGDVKSTLLLLLAAVGFVLLIACANVMNLMLVRSQNRAREIALRVALGAHRVRIVQLLLAESALLATVGGILGLTLGFWGTRLLQAVPLPDMPMLGAFGVDATVLSFTLVVSVVCTVLFGLVPAIGATRIDVNEGLVLNRTTHGLNRQRLSRLLVTGQIALSLVLLVGAGLLSASLVALHKIEPGFEYRNLLSFTVSLPGTRYERPVGTDAFLRRFEDGIRELPGVGAVGVIWPMPLTGRIWSNVYSAGAVAEEDRAYAGYRVGTPTMFAALGVELLEGETFGNRDPQQAIIVSRSVADRSWPGQPAIGKSVRANPWGAGFEPFEVIGVVNDVRFSDLKDDPEPTLYFDSKAWSWTDWEMNVAVRSSGSPEALLPAIRERLLAMDSEIPIAHAQSMETFIDQRNAPNRFALLLIGCFAGVALVLAAIGLYGVLSYSVNQRRKELGIRIALGSESRDILTLVLRQGLIITSSGVVLGLAGAAGLTRFLEAFLVGTTPTDLRTFSVVTGLLMTVALLACYVPARRATRVDALTVLRSD